MVPASIDTIKTELKQLPPKKVLELVVRLARFKKENKELLTWLLFESSDEAAYIAQVRKEITEEVEKIDGLTAYQYKKQFRKIQRKINKPIKYMGSKTAAAELYMHMIELIDRKKKTVFIRAFLEKAHEQYVRKVNILLPGIPEDLAADISRQLRQVV